MDLEKTLYAFLIGVRDESIPRCEDLKISLDDFSTIVEFAKSKELVINVHVVKGGKGNKIVGVNIANAKITMKGLQYLKENSVSAKTLKGFKEIASILK